SIGCGTTTPESTYGSWSVPSPISVRSRDSVSWTTSCPPIDCRAASMTYGLAESPDPSIVMPSPAVITHEQRLPLQSHLAKAAHLHIRHVGVGRRGLRYLVQH